MTLIHLSESEFSRFAGFTESACWVSESDPMAIGFSKLLARSEDSQDLQNWKALPRFLRILKFG